MDAGEIHRVAAAAALDLPGASRGRPFGPDWDVFKVGGKVFLLLTDEPGERVAVLKSAPADALALRQEFADVTPGYHMNKRHWITLNGGGTLTAAVVEELVTESYLLVWAGLPRSARPILPDALIR